MDMFSKITRFLSCYKINYATNITDLFFKEIVWLHVVFRSIVFNCFVKFLNYFWKVLWGN
jgi:hypothetical protein